MGPKESGQLLLCAKSNPARGPPLRRKGTLNDGGLARVGKTLLARPRLLPGPRECTQMRYLLRLGTTRETKTTRFIFELWILKYSRC